MEKTAEKLKVNESLLKNSTVQCYFWGIVGAWYGSVQQILIP